MVPPRVPQFNWIDLGLPSGTLWLDRLVGAESPSAPGLFYQWGAVVGHTIEDVEDGFHFNNANYEAQGLNLIDSDLNDAHDAARAYYGPTAKMPTAMQVQELIDNCVISFTEESLVIFTSSVNGHTLKVHPHGFIQGVQLYSSEQLRAWISQIAEDDPTRAKMLHSDSSQNYITVGLRAIGQNIMAVHS